MSLEAFIIGFIASALVGAYAMHKNSLTLSGWSAAVFIGTLLYGFAGGYAFFLLMVFFGSSSLISRFNPDKVSSKRTAVQVFANGLPAAIVAIFYGFLGYLELYALMIASIGIATTDTWSSEIGRLSKHPPRHIFTLKPIKTGLSGGVTLLGFLASAGAALLMTALSVPVVPSLPLLSGIFLFSFLGSVIDSMLGVIQVKYKDILGDVTELKTAAIEKHSGLSFLDNNLVNAYSNGLGILAFIIYITLL